MSSGRYFERRELAHPAAFEDGYWAVVTDPDGRRRDRSTEREQHLADVSEELAFARSLPGGRVLDVGCGLGFFLSGLGDGWERHGVEISSLAASHAATWGQIHVGTLESADYPDAWFDLLVLHHVIEHVDEPARLMQEALRVLAPGGALVLGTPDFDGACARRFGDKYRLLHDATHVSLFSADGMHRFLRDLGLVVCRVAYPFFETRHFTRENLLRLFDTTRISPPFHGNFMTFYCAKPRLPKLVGALLRLSAVGARDVARAERQGADALDWLREVRAARAPLRVVAPNASFAEHVATLFRHAVPTTAAAASEATVPEGTRVLSFAPRDEPSDRTLCILPEDQRSAARVLSFPEHAAWCREPAQLLLVQALLAEQML